MILVKPDTKYRQSFLEALDEMETDSDRLSWVYLGDTASTDTPRKDFSEYVQSLLKRETNPPQGFVCDTTFWAIENEEVIGRIAIRHELNEFLKKTGGHIGYITRPSWRKRGIATEMLRQILFTDRARSIGNLLLTCDEDNLPSEKTIIKNGGKFSKIIPLENRPGKKHFWIDLTEVDVSQLRRNLSLSYDQRLEAHQAALDLFWDLRKAGEKLREESQ